MSDSLATYLHDHLAGSHFAVKLLDSLHDQYKDEALGQFAAALGRDVKEDQHTLQEIIAHVGEAHLDLTEAAGWLVEKASQFKLSRDESGGGLGTFEAIETLTLGIQGKLALWRVLPSIREIDDRIPAAYDFNELAGRAEDQYIRVEQQRSLLVRTTFRPLVKNGE
jgi:hypothetical protein